MVDVHEVPSQGISSPNNGTEIEPGIYATDIFKQHEDQSISQDENENRVEEPDLVIS